MSGLVSAIRKALGLSEADKPPVTPEWERESVKERLREHEARLNSIDVRIDTQRARQRPRKTHEE